MDIVLTAGLLNRNLPLSRPSSKVLKGSMSAATIAENVVSLLLDSRSAATSDESSLSANEVDLSTPSDEILSATSMLTATCIQASSDEPFNKISASLKTGQAVNSVLVTGMNEDEMKSAETLLCNLELCCRQAIKK